MNPRSLLLCVSLLLCLPFAAAHLAGGTDVTADNATFDIGWDPEPIIAGESTTFSFAAVGVNGSAAPVIWVRILQGTTIVFAGDLHATDGVATIGLVLPQPGTYDLTIRAGQASASIPLVVGQTPRSPLPIIAGAASLCGILIAAWMIATRGKKGKRRRR